MAVDDLDAASFRRLMATLRALRAAHGYAEHHPNDVAFHERHRANLRAFRADVQRWRGELMARRIGVPTKGRALLEGSKAAIERSRRLLAAMQERSHENPSSPTAVARVVNARTLERFRAAHAAGLSALKRHDYTALRSALSLERDAIMQLRHTIDDVNAFIREMRAIGPPRIPNGDPMARTSATKRSSTKRELIDTGTDTRYVKRTARGRFKESDDVGRSQASDPRRAAKKTVKSGYGDQGDRRRKRPARRSAARKSPARKSPARKSSAKKQ